MAVVAIAVAIPLLGLLLLSVGAFAGFAVYTRRSSNTTATQLAHITALARAQTATVESWTDTPTLAPSTPQPTLVPGEIAKLFEGPFFARVLLDDNQLIQVPAGEAWLIAVNHRGFGANADLHVDGGSQVQLQSVTDARFQARLLAGSRAFVQSGPYANGAEIEFAGLPMVTLARGCLGVEFNDEATLTALCFQGFCSLSTDFGVTADEIGAGQSVTLDTTRPVAAPPRPFLPAEAAPYWAMLQQTAAGLADAQQCDVPMPASAASPTTQSGRGPGPGSKSPSPPSSTPQPPTSEPPTSEPPTSPPPTSEPPTSEPPTSPPPTP